MTTERRTVWVLLQDVGDVACYDWKIVAVFACEAAARARKADWRDMSVEEWEVEQ